MSKQNDNKVQRRAVVAGMAAAAGIGVCATGARAQSSQAGFQPKRHDLDAWFDVAGVSHRAFVDTASPRGATDALRYAANILNAHSNAYEGSDEDYSMVVCFRHGSTQFGYTDAIWEKYGAIFNNWAEYLDPATGEAPKRNLLRTGSGPFGGGTIDPLTARGVKFAICATATRGLSGIIANATGQTADDVFAELTANGIPNSHFVPAGVMAATRSQEYGYSLLSVG